MLEKRLLQAAILLAGFVPVTAGAFGAVDGAAFVRGALGPAGDSQFRYLSGLLLGIGLVFWGAFPASSGGARRFARSRPWWSWADWRAPWACSPMAIPVPPTGRWSWSWW